MEKNEIEAKIKDILGRNKITKKSINEISLTDHFINDLDVDSVGMVTALTAIEKVFEIEIPQESFTLENFATIELMINYVQHALENKGIN